MANVPDLAGQRIAYVRVSSAGQNLARQLEAVGECDQTFTEQQSGKSATDRPQLQALIRHVRRGDHVVVAAMDRLARSVIDLNDKQTLWNRDDASPAAVPFGYTPSRRQRDTRIAAAHDAAPDSSVHRPPSMRPPSTARS